MSYSRHIAEQLETDPSRLRKLLWKTRASALSPPPRMTPSEWAEANVKLSRQTSSQAGRLRLFPYQRGILDAFAEEGAEVVAFLKSARVGYTQMLALGIGYYLEHSASPILSVFPAEQDARYFEKTYIRPLVNDTEVLEEILPDIDDQQWHSKTTLRGSSLEMKQAVKYDTFRAFNSRLSIGDEVDAPGWNPGGGDTGEGDKTALLRNRGDSFADGRMILGSTPTIAGRSRIESWFERGDQRRRFLPCPDCGEMQYLEWGGPETLHGIKWPKDRPGDAYYVCKECGSCIDESKKGWMDENGEWRATNPNAERGVVSFHINALYAPWKKSSWGRLAEEFVEATRLSKEEGNKERLQAFVNTKLGETWRDYEEERGTKGSHELGALCEHYHAPVPSGVRFLTAGVDTQSGKRGTGGYFELSIYGWGVRERPFLIGHWKLDHPIESPHAGEQLAEMLSQPWRGEDGRDYIIQAACIDAGGHYQQAVLDFCATWRQKKSAAARWFPIKGWSAGNGKRGPAIWKTAISKSVKVYSVDVDLSKDATHPKIHEDTRLDRLVMPSVSLSQARPCDADFFSGLTKEKKEFVRGSSSWTWTRKAKGNEPWDCLQYAFAAVQALKSLPPPNPFIALLDAPPVSSSPVEQGHDPATPARPKRKKSGFRVSSRR